MKKLLLIIISFLFFLQSFSQGSEWDLYQANVNFELGVYMENAKWLYKKIESNVNATTDKLLLLNVESTSQAVLPQKNIYNVQLATDGSDVTKSLQDQIDSIPDGTVGSPNIIQLPSGKFWTEGIQDTYFRNRTHVTEVKGRKNLIILGYDTTFYTKAPSVAFGGSVSNGEYSYRRHFRIIDSENITVKGLRIEGSNYTEGYLLGTEGNTPEFWKSTDNDGQAPVGFSAYQSYWEFEHGFDILGGKNITLEDCEVYAVWGDGYYIGHNTTAADGVKILNCSTRWNGRQGIAMANSCQNILIDNLTVDLSRRSGVDLEPHSESGFVRNVIIRNSNIHCRLTPFAAGGRGDVSNITIENNTYSGTGYSLYIRNSDVYDELILRQNWTFRGNTRIGGTGSGAIKIAWADNVLIENNIDYHGGHYYASGLFTRNLTVRNNTVRGVNLVRIAGVENLVTEFEVFDNTAAIKDWEWIEYAKMKEKYPL